MLRADVARRLGDEETATSTLTKAAATQLTTEERDSVHDDLVRLAELRGQGAISSRCEAVNQPDR
ncbi:hypothetical protein GCM10009535_03210 [Streptomyces thermocarboxydovorans]|uniref:Uncharacterized protein n=1 Tax=Streptomyces thermocarboxydovorans TaxID=59298 RepID=A0ABN1H765_9ACTN